MCDNWQKTDFGVMAWHIDNSGQTTERYRNFHNAWENYPDLGQKLNDHFQERKEKIADWYENRTGESLNGNQVIAVLEPWHKSWWGDDDRGLRFFLQGKKSSKHAKIKDDHLHLWEDDVTVHWLVYSPEYKTQMDLIEAMYCDLTKTFWEEKYADSDVVDGEPSLLEYWEQKYVNLYVDPVEIYDWVKEYFANPIQTHYEARYIDWCDEWETYPVNDSAAEEEREFSDLGLYKYYPSNISIVDRNSVEKLAQVCRALRHKSNKWDIDDFMGLRQCWHTAESTWQTVKETWDK